MPRSGEQELAEECRVFCRYLAGVEATEDVVRAYQRAHDVSSLKLNAATPMDRALLQLASGSTTLTRIADSFAAPLVPGGALRRKLVLLLAILESRGASASQVDHAVPGSRLIWVAGAAFHGAAWFARLVVAALLLVPLRLWHLASDHR
jgi:hypothetical protein